MKISITIGGLAWLPPCSNPYSMHDTADAIDETRLELDTPDTVAALEQIEPFFLRALGRGELLEMPSTIRDMEKLKEVTEQNGAIRKECTRMTESARKAEASRDKANELADVWRRRANEAFTIAEELRNAQAGSGARWPRGLRARFYALLGEWPNGELKWTK